MKTKNKEVIEFVDNYINQDNRGCAWPYTYVVTSKVYRTKPLDTGDYTLHSCDELGLHGYKSKKKLEEDIRGHGYDPNGIIIDVCDVEIDYDDVQWFFTRHEAEKYVEENKHNHVELKLIVRHMQKGSEAEMILKNMFMLAGEDYDKHAVLSYQDLVLMAQGRKNENT